MTSIPAPPLGLRPRWVVDQKRTAEIIDAMCRYSNESMAIPADWIEELAEIESRRRKDMENQ